MGKRIDDKQNRKRQQNRTILIACEGKNSTEKRYFNNFDGQKKQYKIHYAKGNETDPISLVNNLVKSIKEKGLDFGYGDKAYCVFDVDTNPNKNEQIQKATNLASKNNIQIITSTPSIEFWFLLHYKYTSMPMDNKRLLAELRKFYPKYEKNCDAYSETIDKIDVAVKNSKKINKYHEDLGRKIGSTDANPSTEIYKIVEELLN